VEKEGKINSTKRESTSEMYMCELRDELWKGCAILNKEKKKEMVQMLEQKWKEETATITKCENNTDDRVKRQTQ